MIRLGLLMLATLLGLYAVLAIYGAGDLRADRRPPPPPEATAAQDAGAAPATAMQAEAPAEIIPAASQTPEQVVEFPGPELMPSPEHAADDIVAPAPAADADMLYVTATRLNMRSGPGSGNPVVSALDQGTGVMPVGDARDGWIEVSAPGGSRGFVSTDFLSTEAP
ncbi:SH3 domain-containing protein [Paracoccus rhizosphaerae]|uniref:SH3 domain-containing protein n=1 Tax=Paracoccus rhizosphaerae TaxID=1133347 RepID=A0ABV6CE03_9RHOB|nr:SH3 domain-containing protein [Paracoccus rhizosphaerae]